MYAPAGHEPGTATPLAVRHVTRSTVALLPSLGRRIPKCLSHRHHRALHASPCASAVPFGRELPLTPCVRACTTIRLRAGVAAVGPHVTGFWPWNLALEMAARWNVSLDCNHAAPPVADARVGPGGLLPPVRAQLRRSPALRP